MDEQDVERLVIEEAGECDDCHALGLCDFHAGFEAGLWAAFDYSETPTLHEGGLA